MGGLGGGFEEARGGEVVLDLLESRQHRLAVSGDGPLTSEFTQNKFRELDRQTHRLAFDLCTDELAITSALQSCKIHGHSMILLAQAKSALYRPTKGRI